jgi:putative transposase
MAERIWNFSVGFSQLMAVRKYIAGQGEHQRNIWFQDELRSLFGRYELAFDEQRVWD